MSEAPQFGGDVAPTRIAIAAELHRLVSPIYHFDEIDSTNAALLRAAESLPDGTVLTADFQTAGQGRFQRRWEATRDHSLLLSVLLHEAPNSPLFSIVTLLVARAMSDILREEFAVPCEIRWPNDLVIAGRKVGGVLAQSTTHAGRAERSLVVGIGINCNQEAADFDPSIRGRATSLQLVAGAEFDRESLRDAFLAKLDANLIEVAKPDHSDRSSAASLPHSADRGRWITLRVDNHIVSGRVLDCRLDGTLLIRRDDGTEILIEAATATRIETHGETPGA